MNKHQILHSESFRNLVKKRWLFSLSMSVLILTLYFGFILVIAFKKDLLAGTFAGKLSIGIPIGIGIIFFSWILTGVYVLWANRYYDNHVKEIKDQFIK